MGLTLKNDVIFKAVFGRETEECRQALMGMLNLILDRKEAKSAEEADRVKHTLGDAAAGSLEKIS